MGCRLQYIQLRWDSAIREKVFRVAALLAVPNAMLTCFVVQYRRNHPGVLVLDIDQSAFGVFASMIGIFVAFRASQAYSRYWEGATNSCEMVAEFFDVASSLIAFCTHSRASPSDVESFQHVMIRLFSVLHSLILEELSAEVQSDTAPVGPSLFPVIDPQALDRETLMALMNSDRPIDLVFQWIQSLIVDAYTSGIINVPAPICTRAFQELNAGMVQFHNAVKITRVPFPFPYSASAEIVLALHWLLVPFVASGWSQSAVTCACISFVQVFALWSLNFIAVELENPFGTDLNDLKLQAGHDHFNQRIRNLLASDAHLLPRLATDEDPTMDPTCRSRGLASGIDGLSMDITLLEAYDALREETAWRKDMDLPESPTASPSSMLPMAWRSMPKLPGDSGVGAAGFASDDDYREKAVPARRPWRQETPPPPPPPTPSVATAPASAPVQPPAAASGRPPARPPPSPSSPATTGTMELRSAAAADADHAGGIASSAFDPPPEAAGASEKSPLSGGAGDGSGRSPLLPPVAIATGMGMALTEEECCACALERKTVARSPSKGVTPRCPGLPPPPCEAAGRERDRDWPRAAAKTLQLQAVSSSRGGARQTA